MNISLELRISLIDLADMKSSITMFSKSAMALKFAKIASMKEKI